MTYAEAFWGLYLPVTTTFRVCDIWRGFWVQRLLWDIGGHLLFGTATVQQVRNGHSYIKDMDEEYQLYHQSGSFARFLGAWSSSHPSLAQRIGQLARDIAAAGFWQSKEVEIMDAWLADLRTVGYVFPSVVSPPKSMSNATRKRAAICVTGIAECLELGWTPTYADIRRRLTGDLDVFLFLSSSMQGGSVPLWTRLKQVRSYMNSTVTVLYEDRDVDPRIPTNCSVFYDPFMQPHHTVHYYQQLWGLAECYDLVKEYERTMNITYELFLRARPDTYLTNTSSTFEPFDTSAILIPDEYHYGGVNDRFAIGSMALMEGYMRRWHDLRMCRVRNLHAETYLKLTLARLGTKVHLTPNISYREIAHDAKECH